MGAGWQHQEAQTQAGSKRERSPDKEQGQELEQDDEDHLDAASLLSTLKAADGSRGQRGSSKAGQKGSAGFGAGQRKRQVENGKSRSVGLDMDKVHGGDANKDSGRHGQVKLAEVSQNGPIEILLMATASLA